MFYTDANVLIGVLEAGLGGPALSRFLLDPKDRAHSLITSEITVSEVFVGPLRRGDHDLLARYRLLFAREDIIRLAPVTRSVLERAAELRAASAMRLPDAVHVATALISGCDTILSQDRRLYIPEPARQVDPFTDGVIPSRGAE